MKLTDKQVIAVAHLMAFLDGAGQEENPVMMRFDDVKYVMDRNTRNHSNLATVVLIRELRKYGWACGYVSEEGVPKASDIVTFTRIIDSQPLEFFQIKARKDKSSLFWRRDQAELFLQTHTARATQKA